MSNTITLTEALAAPKVSDMGPYRQLTADARPFALRIRLVSGVKSHAMAVQQQKRGILLSFPTRESATPRPKNESCRECERLESAYEAVIVQINAIVRGPFTTVSEKLTRLLQMQDERDRILAQFYSHKRELHPRKTA